MEVLKQENEEHTCSFVTPSLAFAYDIAFDHGDLEIFKTAASAIMAGPSCDSSGDSPGKLRHGVIGNDVLDMCPACYAGVFAPLGLSSSFEEKHVEGKPCALRVGFFGFEVYGRMANLLLTEGGGEGGGDLERVWESVE